MAEPQQAWMGAFASAQADMPPLHKGRTVTVTTQAGGSYSYSYADLPTILEIVQPVLQKHGLALAQAVISEDGRVGVETRIYHKDGHVEVFGPLLLAAGNNAQAAGSAVTYARRYSLCAALGIAADEDDDGASAVRPEPEPQPSAEELAKRGTNKLKAEALALMGDPDEAKDLFARALAQVGVFEPIPADRQDEVRKALEELAP